MSVSLDCPSTLDDQVASRYATGRLEPDALEAFEIHLMGCARCQDAVRHSAALSAALRAPNAPVRRWSAWRLGIVPLAAAALLAVWLARSDGDGVNDLARVDVVPTFEGTSVRSATDAATRAADDGMDAYARGDFSRAASNLAKAGDGASSPAIAFYLGVARLKTGDGAGAASALRSAHVMASPYAPEAALYLAKAWLALGRTDSALAVLQRIDSQAPVAAHAAALADSIRTVIQR